MRRPSLYVLRDLNITTVAEIRSFKIVFVFRFLHFEFKGSEEARNILIRERFLQVSLNGKIQKVVDRSKLRGQRRNRSFERISKTVARTFGRKAVTSVTRARQR